MLLGLPGMQAAQATLRQSRQTPRRRRPRGDASRTGYAEAKMIDVESQIYTPDASRTGYAEAKYDACNGHYRLI